MSKYQITIDAEFTEEEIRAVLDNLHAVVNVLEIKTIPDIQWYTADLMVDGELIDYVHIHTTEEGVMNAALKIFKASKDYDVIPTSQITEDHIRIELRRE